MFDYKHFMPQSLFPVDFSSRPRAVRKALQDSADGFGRYSKDLGLIARIHAERVTRSAFSNAVENSRALAAAFGALSKGSPVRDWREYREDASQRSLLYLDALRQRGNYFIDHEECGDKTVLSWDHVTVVDGSTMARPVNYSLVRIIPPEGVTVREDGRPYIIIDPRAGHGSGIGGFKDESQVGAAIRQGHPTYFVTFTRLPVPGQTLADVTSAEAHFVREVRRLHPDAPKPIIVGNCQGGWAAMLLAASSADITGPVVANGSPLSYWAGEKGKNPMRYLGGLTGGSAAVRLMSDLGNGLFDGSNLVLNFERLNPAETWWGKYYNLWDRIDTEVPRFVEFERWWGAFYYLTGEEIAWIVDNLFLGNRLGRGCANLNERTHIDLRCINSPIIVFASHGDNITPPLQALGWIRDYYDSVEEIRARGQRILYTLHKDAGHLGIFVSSSVSRKEHRQIVSTLKSIEALQPGLYELVITDEAGAGEEKEFQVSFAERTIDEMMQQCGGDDSNLPFAAVARFSELGSEIYDLALRPAVRAAVGEGTAQLRADLSPMRFFRMLESDRNPWMKTLAKPAEAARKQRRAAPATNPFRMLERFNATLVYQWWNGVRDLHDALIEWNFHALWGMPWIQSLGEHMSRTVSEAPLEDMRTLSTVQDAIDRIELGGFAEAVIRMLILLAHTRKDVRRSRLERSNTMLTTTEPFAGMTPKERTRMIHRQSLVVSYEPDEAVAALPKMLPTRKQRERALALCEEIAGPREEMSTETIALFDHLTEVLGQKKPAATRTKKNAPQPDASGAP